MNYVYSEKYGDRSDQFEYSRRLNLRLKDRHGDDIPWQADHDTAVDKGLVRVMKEDKMPFARLIAVLRAETVKAMHSQDRWRVPAHQLMDRYKGQESYPTLAQYWDRLTEDIKQSRAALHSKGE